MKKVFAVLLIFGTIAAKSQTSNDILNLLIQNKAITQEQADSLRAEHAIKQQNSLPDKKFKVDFEVRPRSEYRHGYQQLPNDTSTYGFHISQRSRLGLSFVNESKLAAQFTIQDIRVWGIQDPKSSTASTLQVFEAWAEPYITENLSVRIGRQRIAYDNQRLFADNNWRQGAVSHDALNIRYNADKLTSETALAFNQSSELLDGTNYAPKGFENYKFLAVNFSRFKVIDNLYLSLLNSADGYQNATDAEKLNIRYTNGGRVDYDLKPFSFTMAGYYQSGKSAKDKNIDAWYIQPEVKLVIPSNTTFRLGAEVFSGNTPQTSVNNDRAFSPLYGSGHSFNGSLDLITKFPSDVSGAGLVNPYLFIIHPLGKMFELRADFHLFYLKEDYISNSETINKYLGFENDLLVSYIPNNFTKIDLGFSWANTTESFEIVKKAKAGANEYTPTWAYIMITFKPQLFSASFK